MVIVAVFVAVIVTAYFFVAFSPPITYVLPLLFTAFPLLERGRRSAQVLRGVSFVLLIAASLTLGTVAMLPAVLMGISFVWAFTHS
jgi:hypothetical protein